jgi:hypothetical protein
LIKVRIVFSSIPLRNHLISFTRHLRSERTAKARRKDGRARPIFCTEILTAKVYLQQGIYSAFRSLGSDPHRVQIDDGETVESGKGVGLAGEAAGNGERWRVSSRL